MIHWDSKGVLILYSSFLIASYFVFSLLSYIFCFEFIFFLASFALLEYDVSISFN